MATDPGHNFIINPGSESPLGFNTYIGSKNGNTYERATADYTKTMVDQTTQVGDQTLTGWWTHGQLSFQQGAGLEFYETAPLGYYGSYSSAAEVGNRYWTSTQCNPWKAGQISVAEAFTLKAATGVALVLSLVSELWLLSTSGQFATYSGSTLSGWTTPSISGTIEDATTDGNDIYVATTAGIYKQTAGAGAFTTLYGAAPDSATWKGVWWAKSRLFAVDSLGRWFTLGAAGGTATDTDIFWYSPLLSGWSCVDGAASAYLVNKTTIWAVGVDTSDSTSAGISAATSVATLPVGETISSVAYYLGQLNIATNLGVRSALVQSDGSLIYGARFIEGDFSHAVEQATYGDYVYVAGAEATQGAGVYEVSMATDVADLVPAWQQYVAADAGNSGAFVMPSASGWGWWDDTGIHVPSGSAFSSATFNTGSFRLGTLENKVYRFLTLEMAGTGTVDIKVVTPDGTVTDVTTVDAPGSYSIDLSAALPSPVEFVSITFVLSSAAVLKTFQLKALPTPKRQRLIKVPLMLFDSERAATGQVSGAEGSAWARLAALEALEEANAVVTFADKRTGEQGEAFIEQIDVVVDSPSSRPNSIESGFGGTLTITLRKIATLS